MFTKVSERPAPFKFNPVQSSNYGATHYRCTKCLAVVPRVDTDDAEIMGYCQCEGRDVRLVKVKL